MATAGMCVVALVHEYETPSTNDIQFTYWVVDARFLDVQTEDVRLLFTEVKVNVNATDGPNRLDMLGGIPLLKFFYAEEAEQCRIRMQSLSDAKGVVPVVTWSVQGTNEYF